jgi:hypothetical protein
VVKTEKSKPGMAKVVKSELELSLSRAGLKFRSTRRGRSEVR